MIKKLILASALVLPLALASCNGKKSCGGGDRCARGDRQVVYTGTLPAADVSGVRYTLHLDYDDDHGYTDGDYKMYVSYIKTDTTSVGGVRDLRTIRSEGDFKEETGTPSDPALKYLKLVPDVRDSGPGASSEPVYFAVTSDSTLVMLDKDLAMPQRPADYTLTAR